MPIAELKEIKGNEKMLLSTRGYESIYDAKKQLGMNAPEIYAELFNEYNDTVKIVNENIRKQRSERKFKEELKKAKEIVKAKEAEKKAREARNKAKKEIKKQEKKEIKKQKEMKLIDVKNKVYQITGTDKVNISNLRYELMNLIGESAIVTYIVDKKVIITTRLDIPETFSSWWSNSARFLFMKNSDTSIFDEYENRGSIFIYEALQNITPRQIIQSFLDGGLNHCLITPIDIWANQTLTNAKTESSKKKYKSIINKLEKFKITYANGVPENEISNMCNDLQIDITIDLPFQLTKFIQGKSNKKPLKHFKFINTRINHIELNEITNTTEFIDVSIEQLYKLVNELDKKKEFYTFTRDSKNINSITTLTGKYKINSIYDDVVNIFELKYEMNECCVDDISQKQLSMFIRSGTHYNSTVDFVNINEQTYNEDNTITHSLQPPTETSDKCFYDNKEVFHRDMEKAYINFKECKYYEGFLGKITDFRQTNKIEGVGLYQIDRLRFHDSLFKKYNDKLKIYQNGNVYTSAELKMLTENGVKYKIIAGCWGVEPLYFDFDFIEEMKTQEINGVKYYAHWVGQIDSHFLKKKFWINGDENMYNILCNIYGNNMIKKYSNGEICIEVKKEVNKHKGHISAFITAYQRLSVIEQLLEMDINDIVRVCVDGIYHFNNTYKMCNVFRIKNEFNFNNETGNAYINNTKYSYENTAELADYRKNYSTELFKGEGGNGKTHLNLTDKGLVKVLFICPSWKLAEKKREDYGVDCEVTTNILTTDPTKYGVIKRNYNVFVIDEVSMMENKSKEYIFKTYSNIKVIFCGDIEYQAPPFNKDGTPVIEINENGFENIIELDINYRYKCDKLKELSKQIRSMIKEKVNDYKVNKYVKNIVQKINDEELKEMYSVNHMILARSHKVKDRYTDMFKHMNKWYVTENTRLYKNGQVIIGDKPNTRCELRHSYTIHSIQGETAENKLFINMDTHYPSRLLYTAISRARYLNQIYIIITENNTQNNQLIQNRKCKDCEKNCNSYYRCLDCHLTYKNSNKNINENNEIEMDNYDDNDTNDMNDYDEDLYAQQE